MRLIILALLATAAACSGDDGATEPDARSVDADQGLHGGAWGLTWTCRLGCGDVPALTLTTGLEVDHLRLTFTGPGGAVHDATVNNVAPSCLDVEGEDWGEQVRQFYQLCAAGTGLEAELTWWRGQSRTAYRLLAWR